MDIQEVGWEDVDLINVAQGKVRWRAMLNAVMKFRFPYNSEFFFQQAEEILDSE
jgi:hypothetical protein